MPNASVKTTKAAQHSPWMVCMLLTALVGLLCFFSAWWYARTYGRIGFDSVMFTLSGNLNGVNTEHLLGYLLGGALPALAATALVGLLLHWLRRKLARKWITPLVIAASLGLTIHAAYNAGLAQHLLQSLQTTSIYETHYVDPRGASITFPTKKRNLVYIILESMETSYLSQDQGGALPDNLIPQLSALAQDNVNFSHNSHVGGFRDVTGTTWTMGALVAQSGGIPLKTSDSDATLPGLYTLSDILHQQGYQQAFMVGSDADFGGRKDYFLRHGVDAVYDLYTAWQDGVVESGYDNQFWGIEDSQLYGYAQTVLTQLSQAEQPFAFTLLTVDTHSPSGYLCENCGDTHQEAYANVIACADQQLSQFLSWLQAQDFYENTTVVIVGDHSSMNNGFFTRNAGQDYQRHIYNCFLNAAAQPLQTTNRLFSPMDLFPTTLAAMGCTIEADRLGLGTNLFSDQPTLMELYGYEALCQELGKRSDFYSSFYTP